MTASGFRLFQHAHTKMVRLLMETRLLDLDFRFHKEKNRLVGRMESQKPLYTQNGVGSIIRGENEGARCEVQGAFALSSSGVETPVKTISAHRPWQNNLAPFLAFKDDRPTNPTSGTCRSNHDHQGSDNTEVGSKDSDSWVYIMKHFWSINIVHRPFI